LAVNKPPKLIPINEISDLLLRPFDVLLDCPELSDATKDKLEAALVQAKEQRALINAKFNALNKQVQALLAEWDWT